MIFRCTYASFFAQECKDIRINCYRECHSGRHYRYDKASILSFNQVKITKPCEGLCYWIVYTRVWYSIKLLQNDNDDNVFNLKFKNGQEISFHIYNG